MPHPFFEIDDLVRPVIDDLVKTSRRSAVSLALTCRSLEEPALSSLWKRQNSLIILVKVLPNHAWARDNNGIETIVSGCNFPANHIYLTLQTPSGDRARTIGGGLD